MNKNILRIVLATIIVLLIPLLFNWPWGLFDYVVAAILIMGVGLVYAFVIKRATGKTRRILLALVIFGIFALIWGELAVGIFNTPFAGD